MQGRELNGVTRNNTACIENLLQGRLSSCTSRLEEKMFRMTLCGLVVSSDHPYHLATSMDGYADFLKCIIGFFSFSFTHHMYLSGECVRDTCLTEYTDVQVPVTMHAQT